MRISLTIIGSMIVLGSCVSRPQQKNLKSDNGVNKEIPTQKDKPDLSEQKNSSEVDDEFHQAFFIHEGGDIKEFDENGEPLE